MGKALGVPTGSHGAFRDYQVDAVTMEISPKQASINKDRQTEFLFRGGRYTLYYDSCFLTDTMLHVGYCSFFMYWNIFCFE